MTDPRLELRIGAPVEATDRRLGHVHQVVLNPVQRHVVGLVVRTGLLPRRDLIVPAELIADATGERVTLRVTYEDARQQPAFNPAHYLSLAAEEQGYKTGEALVSIHGGAGGTGECAPVTLRRGQQVWATDGRAGRIRLLLLDTGDQVHHFVVRRGRVPGRDVIVPVDRISAIDERGVWLATERTALDRLPTYRPDSAIVADVDQALWADKMIREFDIKTIDVAVRDGVVVLSGYAATSESKVRAARVARRVPGVLRVENRIVTDGEVAVAVAQALASDAQTREQRILVHAGHGVVTLGGEISSDNIRAAAEEVAAGVPQVRGVINKIRTPGVVVDPAKQRVLQPRIGQGIYARDMVLGRIEWVIVHPRRRRVAGVVVHGRFPDPTRAGPHTLPDDVPRRERWVVIPIEIAQDVTAGGVMLTISGADATRYPDFDPDDFVPPDADWPPPYPYTHADVLLDLRGVAAALADYLTVTSAAG